jgi:hypothetical protein
MNAQERNHAKPDRMAFFAHRFCRLMGKVCLGQEIGPEACWLLAFIVHTQDKVRYARPVIFFNDDLASRTGFSVSAMRRARERAVSAGWLTYTEGAKRRPASYEVAIPEWAVGMHDGAGDEDPAELAEMLRQSDAESGGKPAHNRQERGGDAAGTRQECEQPSSYSSSHSHSKEPPTPLQGEDEVFCAIEEVCGMDASVASVRRTLNRKTKELLDAKPPYTAADVREFGRRYWELCPHARDKRERPTPAELAKWIGQLRTKKKREAARRQKAPFQAPEEPRGPSLHELGLNIKDLMNKSPEERKRIMDNARAKHEAKHATPKAPPPKQGMQTR